MLTYSTCSDVCRARRLVLFELYGNVVNGFACVIAASRQNLRRHWGRTDPSTVAIVPARWSSDNNRGM